MSFIYPTDIFCLWPCRRERHTYKDGMGLNNFIFLTPAEKNGGMRKIPSHKIENFIEYFVPVRTNIFFYAEKKLLNSFFIILYLASILVTENII